MFEHRAEIQNCIKRLEFVCSRYPSSVSYTRPLPLSYCLSTSTSPTDKHSSALSTHPALSPHHPPCSSTISPPPIHVHLLRRRLSTSHFPDPSHPRHSIYNVDACTHPEASGHRRAPKSLARTLQSLPSPAGRPGRTAPPHPGYQRIRERGQGMLQLSYLCFTIPYHPCMHYLHCARPIPSILCNLILAFLALFG